MSGKKWDLIDTVLSIVIGVGSLASIFTGIKSASYKEEEQFKAIEDRYGLKPIEKED